MKSKRVSDLSTNPSAWKHARKQSVAISGIAQYVYPRVSFDVLHLRLLYLWLVVRLEMAMQLCKDTRICHKPDLSGIIFE